MTKIGLQDIDLDNDIDDEMYVPPAKTNKQKKKDIKDTHDKLRTKKKIARRSERQYQQDWENQ